MVITDKMRSEAFNRAEVLNISTQDLLDACAAIWEADTTPDAPAIKAAVDRVRNEIDIHAGHELSAEGDQFTQDLRTLLAAARQSQEMAHALSVTGDAGPNLSPSNSRTAPNANLRQCVAQIVRDPRGMNVSPVPEGSGALDTADKILSILAMGIAPNADQKPFPCLAGLIQPCQFPDCNCAP